MPAALEPFTPLWWVHRLEAELRRDQAERKRYVDYYEGRHNLRYSTPKFKEAFGGLFDAFADNWCELIVDAVEERLDIEGFRFGEDQAADQGAWRIWQVSGMDAESQQAHSEAIVQGRAYAMVWPGPSPDDEPTITVEHPDQVVVAHASGNRRRRLAALKVWREEWTGQQHATLFLPEAVYKFRSRWAGDSGLIVPGSLGVTSRWVPRDPDPEDAGRWPLPNPLGAVPVVALHNRPRMLADGVSEIAQTIPVQEAVNKLLADLLIAAEFSAFRQKWMTGMEVPKDPATGKPIEQFQAAVNRMFQAKSPDARFGDFDQTDLTNFVSAIEMLVSHIASQSRTPPHYFSIGGQQWPSGDAIRSAEAGLSMKARRKTRFFGESWEELIRLALRAAGDQRRELERCEVVWRDVEVRSEAQRIDGLVKLKQLGVPDEVLWRRAGFTPVEIEQIKQLRAEEQRQATAALLDARGAFDADVAPDDGDPNPDPDADPEAVAA